MSRNKAASPTARRLNLRRNGKSKSLGLLKRENASGTRKNKSWLGSIHNLSNEGLYIAIADCERKIRLFQDKPNMVVRAQWKASEVCLECYKRPKISHSNRMLSKSIAFFNDAAKIAKAYGITIEALQKHGENLKSYLSVQRSKDVFRKTRGASSLPSINPDFHNATKRKGFVHYRKATPNDSHQKKVCALRRNRAMDHKKGLLYRSSRTYEGLYSRGEDYFDRRKYNMAYKKFTEAREREETPEVYAYITRCAEKLEMYSLAWINARIGLDHFPEDTELANLEALSRKRKEEKEEMLDRMLAGEFGSCMPLDQDKEQSKSSEQLGKWQQAELDRSNGKGEDFVFYSLTQI